MLGRLPISYRLDPVASLAVLLSFPDAAVTPFIRSSGEERRLY